MRKIGAVLVASGLLVSGAFAADTSAPLPAGKPAGVQQAQAGGSALLWVFGLAIVGGGIALTVASGSGNNITASTTSTAP